MKKKSSEMKQTREVRIELLSPDGHGPALRVSSTTRRDDRTGLASATRHESAGMRTSKDDSLSTHTRLYLRGHVTAKGNAGLWLWTRLWAPLRGLPPRLHVPPLTVATPSLQSQLYVGRKDIYKAPMPYPHLDPCTSGGMSMTIAPPGGPTRKRCLGPQVLLQDLICLLGVAFVEASGVRQVESQYWVVLG
jgi:hypothetical protein